jgi:hypothetical protein
MSSYFDNGGFIGVSAPFGTKFTPSIQIVTQGLLVHLDAGNTTSYPGSGTTWFDLSGNSRNFTLNNTTFNSANGGSIDFNGSNSTTSKNNLGSLTGFTACVWLKRTGASTGFAGLAFSRSTGNTSGLNFYSTTHTLGYHWNDASNTWGWNSGVTVPDNTWVMATVTVDSVKAVVYLNDGATSATNNVSHSASNFSVFELGADSTANRFFNGDMAISTIYNRALTLSEVAQNYNANRGRFGL